VLHLNASKAAINAGYSESSSRQMGSYLLTIPNIQERIKYMQDNLAETAQLSALRVLKEHEKIAFNDEEKTADKQKSLDSINNMLGYNAPTKNEYSGDAININFINHSKSQ
jgi:phage terminase small subunit